MAYLHQTVAGSDHITSRQSRSALSSAIRTLTMSDRDPSASRPPAPDLQTTGTAAAVPEALLR